MTWFVTSLRENPELAIFLTLAIGFVIGRIRIGSFGLGNVVGTLLAGVLVGQLDIRVEPLVKVVFSGPYRTRPAASCPCSATPYPTPSGTSCSPRGDR